MLSRAAATDAATRATAAAAAAGQLAARTVAPSVALNAAYRLIDLAPAHPARREFTYLHTSSASRRGPRCRRTGSRAARWRAQQSSRERGGSDHSPTFVDLAVGPPAADARPRGPPRVRLAFLQDGAATADFKGWRGQQADGFERALERAGQQAAGQQGDVQQAEDLEALARWPGLKAGIA